MSSKAILGQSTIEPSIPVLDLANKTALPKTLPALTRSWPWIPKTSKKSKRSSIDEKHDLSVFEIEKEGFRLNYREALLLRNDDSCTGCGRRSGQRRGRGS